MAGSSDNGKGEQKRKMKVQGGTSALSLVIVEKEKLEKIDRLLERYGRIQLRRAWHKRSRTGGKRK